MLYYLSYYIIIKYIPKIRIYSTLSKIFFHSFTSKFFLYIYIHTQIFIETNIFESMQILCYYTSLHISNSNSSYVSIKSLWQHDAKTVTVPAINRQARKNCVSRGRNSYVTRGPFQFYLHKRRFDAHRRRTRVLDRSPYSRRSLIAYE